MAARVDAVVDSDRDRRDEEAAGTYLRTTNTPGHAHDANAHAACAKWLAGDHTKHGHNQ